MSTTPTDGQKPPRDPTWLKCLLIAVAIAIIAAAYAFEIPEHRAEIIGFALVLITTIIRP